MPAAMMVRVSAAEEEAPITAVTQTKVMDITLLM